MHPKHSDVSALQTRSAAMSYASPSRSKQPYRGTTGPRSVREINDLQPYPWYKANIVFGAKSTPDSPAGRV
eukprot:1487696-Rhodomonas_salina.1